MTLEEKQDHWHAQGVGKVCTECRVVVVYQHRAEAKKPVQRDYACTTCRVPAKVLVSA